MMEFPTLHSPNWEWEEELCIFKSKTVSVMSSVASNHREKKFQWKLIHKRRLSDHNRFLRLIATLYFRYFHPINNCTCLDSLNGHSYYFQTMKPCIFEITSHHCLLVVWGGQGMSHPMTFCLSRVVVFFKPLTRPFRFIAIIFYFCCW